MGDYTVGDVNSTAGGDGPTITFRGTPGPVSRSERTETKTWTLPEGGIKFQIEVGWRVFYLIFMALLIAWGALAR